MSQSKSKNTDSSRFFVSYLCRGFLAIIFLLVYTINVPVYAVQQRRGDTPFIQTAAEHRMKRQNAPIILVEKMAEIKPLYRYVANDSFVRDMLIEKQKQKDKVCTLGYNVSDNADAILAEEQYNENGIHIKVSIVTLSGFGFYMAEIRKQGRCQNYTLQREHDLYSKYIQQHIGPDEILVYVEGRTLETFSPEYCSCNHYRAFFSVSSSSSLLADEYRVKVSLIRTNYSALNEMDLTFPLVLNYILFDQTITFPYIFPSSCEWKWTAKSVIGDKHLKFELEKHPITLNVSGKDFGRGNLVLSTFVRVSNKLKMTDSLSVIHDCPQQLDRYSWGYKRNDEPCKNRGVIDSASFSRALALGTQLSYIDVKEAALILNGHKIEFSGDSHMGLSGYLVEWSCGKTFGHQQSTFTRQNGALQSSCPNIYVNRDWWASCEFPLGLAKDNTYDIIFINCGHHPAGFLHWSFSRYFWHVSHLAHEVRLPGYFILSSFSLD